MQQDDRPGAETDAGTVELYHVDGWVPEAVRLYYGLASGLIAAMVFWLLVCRQIGLADFWWGAVFLLGPALLAVVWVSRARGATLIADTTGLRLDNSRLAPLLRPLMPAWHIPWRSIRRVTLREVPLDPKLRDVTTYVMHIVPRRGRARRLRPMFWMPEEQIRADPSSWALRKLPAGSTPLGQAFKRFAPDIPMRLTV